MINIRNDFPIFDEHPDLHYLDSAATTQKPKIVIDALKNFYEKSNSNIHRGIYNLSIKASGQYENARKIVADLINANDDEIIFTKGTTEGINFLVYTIDSLINWEKIKKNKESNPNYQPEILISEMEHHSNLVPWQQFAKHFNFKLNFINVNKNTFELDLEDAKSKINENTIIISLTHASNVLGSINPISEISKIAKSINPNILVIVDASQSIPHLFDKVDVIKLGCDFLVFSGHKIYSPNGVGVLYGKKELLDRMRPFLFGGDMVSSVTKSKSTFLKSPQRFEAGTQNIANVISLGVAIKYLKNKGFDNLISYEKELHEYAFEKLKKIKNLKLYHPSNKKSTIPVISFSIEGIHPHDVASFLSEKNICIRAGQHCCMPLMKTLGIQEGLVRLGLSFYNTKQDIDFLINTLKELLNKEISDDSSRELIFELYKNPVNYGFIPKEKITNISHMYNPLCGDQIGMQLSLTNGKVNDIKFQGKGCAISVASSSIITDLIKTKKLTKEEILNLNNEDILSMLNIPISSVRLKCALLPLEAVKKAIENDI